MLVRIMNSVNMNSKSIVNNVGVLHDSVAMNSVSIKNIGMNNVSYE